MTTLSQAPLIEAIFEIRWGKANIPSPNVIAFNFSDDDRIFFIGRFHAIAKERGFETVEATNAGFAGAPHVVSHRFRKAPNTWPCYQIGLGVMTVNQVNDGYDWPTFSQAISDGIAMLDKAHPVGLTGLPAFDVVLRYQDGLIFDPGEAPTEFLRDKLNFSFSVPLGFLAAKEVEEASAQPSNLGFEVTLNRPTGQLVVSLVNARINERPGFVMNTIVRSADNQSPSFNVGAIKEWIEQAHQIQKLAFSAFISPAYMKSFK